MDGKAHSEIFNTVITLKGLEFLKPDRTKTKANLAIIISAIAGVVSLGSLLVSVLANLDKIYRNKIIESKIAERLNSILPETYICNGLCTSRSAIGNCALVFRA